MSIVIARINNLSTTYTHAKDEIAHCGIDEENLFRHLLLSCEANPHNSVMVGIESAYHLIEDTEAYLGRDVDITPEHLLDIVEGTINDIKRTLPYSERFLQVSVKDGLCILTS